MLEGSLKVPSRSSSEVLQGQLRISLVLQALSIPISSARRPSSLREKYICTRMKRSAKSRAAGTQIEEKKTAKPVPLSVAEKLCAKIKQKRHEGYRHDAGRVFVQLMNPGRRTVGGRSNRGAAAAIASSSADDMREMLTGFNAYFGSFDIDQAAGTVIHHLESALIPSWVGTDQRRRYEFSSAGELIILNTASGADYRLVWQRDDRRAK